MVNSSDKQFDDWWDGFDGWDYRSEVCIEALESACQPYDRKTFESALLYWLKSAFEAGQKSGQNQ